MKKNIAMRIAAFLFILTMISTCAFATTFAKYTTSGTATDSARVAKWGVTVVVTGDDAFNTQYASDTTGVSENTVISAGVDAQSIENLVAPGTSGKLFDYTITGKPEVATKVTVVFELNLDNWEIDKDGNPATTETEEYCPIVITVGETEYAILPSESIDAFEDRVENAINKVVTNTAKHDFTDNLTVSWAWAFRSNDANDVKDTALGNLATAPTIAYSINVTVEQVD